MVAFVERLDDEMFKSLQVGSWLKGPYAKLQLSFYVGINDIFCGSIWVVSHTTGDIKVEQTKACQGQL